MGEGQLAVSSPAEASAFTCDPLVCGSLACPREAWRRPPLPAPLAPCNGGDLALLVSTMVPRV